MLKKSHVRELFLFGISGTIAFVVDALVLYLLKSFLGLYIGRAVSFFCGVVTTWLINRNITFKERVSGISLFKEFLSYFSLMIFGGIVNFSFYSWLVTHFSLFTQHPVFAVAGGALSGMGVNWINSRFFLFKKKK
jgi:putative flippase GtrA